MAMYCTPRSKSSRRCVVVCGMSRRPTKTQSEAVAADGAAGVRAVGVVRVREDKVTYGIVSSKFQREEARGFQISDDADGGIPVFWSIAVEDKAPEGVVYVWASGNCKIVQGTDEGPVRCVFHPGGNIGGDE